VLLAAGISLLAGAYDVAPKDAFRVLWAHLLPSFADAADSSSLYETIVWNLRVPRILLAILVGAALSTAGAVFQGCFRNPLVEPYILGVSSGAAFGAALGILLPGFFLSIQASSFAFGSLAVVLTLGLARVRGETPALTLILAGVIVGSVFAALVSILKYLARETSLREIVFWLMGGFYYATWRDVAILAATILPAFAGVWFLGWKLNILSMGDDEARALGVDPERHRFVLVLLATLVTSVSVSTVGIIAWVGLMMPHAARLILGPDHRFLIPGAAAMGAIYLVACDTLARTLTSAELPIGILTSLIGAPYLFYLLKTKGSDVLG
jgi:iron complex transport system permease protein